jgi:glyoxylase-like metal-dependent hydrolase (beta-lactamase superfamily II)
MFGDVVQLADNLWMVVGNLHADVPNALVYRKEERLYLMDSGAGATFRASLLRVLDDVGPVASFTLLNSHGHADHVGNNDLIDLVQAKEKYHYMSASGLPLLDARSYFATQFSTLSALYDPTSGFQAHRARWRALGGLRRMVSAFVGERRSLELVFGLYLRKFQPLRPSIDTIQSFESMSGRELAIGDVRWTGWAMGDDDVWVLEARGHSPDEVLFYLPEHEVLYTADLTLPFFPTFPSSNGPVTREMLSRCQAMTAAGAVRLLVDGHHQVVYRGQDEAAAFLGTLLTEHKHVQAIVRDIVDAHDGLTIGQIYAQLKQRDEDPIVHHYLALEFPYFPMALQQIIAVSVLEMGFAAEGPRGDKRFYRPAKSA